MDYYYFNPALTQESHRNLVRELLAQSDFSDSPRLLGSAKGRGTTWFLHTPELLIDCVKRHYYRGGLFGKFIKDRYFFCGINRTRAMRECQLLEKMHQLGLPVPRAVGVRVCRSGWGYSADILLEKIPHTTDLSQRLQTTPLNEAQYQRIGALIALLHQHQIHHSDLNIHNILCDQHGVFWLIDFDKCQMQTGEAWKAGNLARLKRSFEKEKTRLGIAFSEADWAALQTGYAEAKNGSERSA